MDHHHVVSLFFGYSAGHHSGTGTGMMRPCGDFRLNHERRLSSQLDLVALGIYFLIFIHERPNVWSSLKMVFRPQV
jgi:hypothetical protein